MENDFRLSISYAQHQQSRLLRLGIAADHTRTHARVWVGAGCDEGQTLPLRLQIKPSGWIGDRDKVYRVVNVVHFFRALERTAIFFFLVSWDQ